VKHLEAYRGTPLGAELTKLNHSFPVHPTQIYESLVGLGLLALLLWQRKHQKFRGQIFFLFAFGYGYLRFLLEIIRDDSERGEFGPRIAEHWFIALALLAMSIAFVFGIALGITDPRKRTIARVVAFVPPIAAWIILRPKSFATTPEVQLSTSQWIGVLSAVLVAYFYAKFWEVARKSPKAAMSLESLGDIKPAIDDLAPRRRKRKDEDDDEDDDDDDKSKRKATAAKKPVLAKKRPSEDEDDEDDDDAASEPKKPAAKPSSKDDDDADDDDDGEASEPKKPAAKPSSKDDDADDDDDDDDDDDEPKKDEKSEDKKSEDKKSEDKKKEKTS
jgi:phosphatidylglycerol:prolipoprotein diacylglycerol transferase